MDCTFGFGSSDRSLFSILTVKNGRTGAKEGISKGICFLYHRSVYPCFSFHKGGVSDNLLYYSCILGRTLINVWIIFRINDLIVNKTNLFR